VRDVIAKQFSDPTSDDDVKRYKDYVVRNYGSVSLYEQSVRDALAAQKLRSYVTAGAQVSEAEVKDDFMRDNTAFDVTYVAVTAEDLASKINPSDEEMRQYFDAHKTDYRFLEPQKKIRYLFVSQEKVGQKLTITTKTCARSTTRSSPRTRWRACASSR
jgi:peptidyl-prolyl cis-trans isomerase D